MHRLYLTEMTLLFSTFSHRGFAHVVTDCDERCVVDLGGLHMCEVLSE